MTDPDAKPENLAVDQVRTDSQRLRAQINRQALPHRAFALIGVAVLAALWYWVARELLALGSSLTYDTIQAMDGQITRLLQRASPYLWGAVVLVWTLVMLAIAMAWLRWRGRELRALPVDPQAFAEMAPSLCDEVLDVIGWCWTAPRREPLTLGDLQRTLTEIRHGRIDKLAHMRRQQDWVDGLPG
ncbi:hypothetical protein [Amphibiibacter pelophylacis]|uniref:Uncharacterized protein n=1 Tax=Amphibiibacter pelophylacis TaxID=1799477 RepID=A0ACC6P340_9BURK